MRHNLGLRATQWKELKASRALEYVDTFFLYFLYWKQRIRARFSIYVRTATKKPMASINHSEICLLISDVIRMKTGICFPRAWLHGGGIITEEKEADAGKNTKHKTNKNGER